MAFDPFEPFHLIYFMASGLELLGGQVSQLAVALQQGDGEVHVAAQLRLHEVPGGFILLQRLAVEPSVESLEV